MKINVNALKTVGTTVLARGLFLSRKHAPTILTGVGIVGGVASTVMVAKATLQLPELVEQHKHKVEDINESAKMYDTRGLPVMSEGERGKALAHVYLNTGLDLAKLYGPAVSVGVLSITSIVSAHGMMQKRQTALVAAYATLEKGFSEYRNRVRENLGEDRERELSLGIDTEPGTDADGNDSVVVKKKTGANVSQYAKFFDEYNQNWKSQPDYNRMFLRGHQNYFNHRLQACGHVFLNEVYEALGFEHTPAGAICGWLRDGDGEGFVDFGLNDEGRDAVRLFMRGGEPSILLEFNVDGVIYDKI